MEPLRKARVRAVFVHCLVEARCIESSGCTAWGGACRAHCSRLAVHRRRTHIIGWRCTARGLLVSLLGALHRRLDRPRYGWCTGSVQGLPDIGSESSLSVPFPWHWRSSREVHLGDDQVSKDCHRQRQSGWRRRHLQRRGTCSSTAVAAGGAALRCWRHRSYCCSRSCRCNGWSSWRSWLRLALL